jgi:chromosome segregation ATPase
MADVAAGRKASGVWTLIVVAAVPALSGWGAFAHSRAEQTLLRGEITELAISRHRRTVERDEAKTHLRAAREELTILRGTLGQVTAERDELKAQLIVLRQETASVQNRMVEAQVTGSVRKPAKPARSAALRNRNTR